jgi:hypothetical protein
MSLFKTPAGVDSSTEEKDGNHLEIVLPESLLHGISQVALAKGMTVEQAIKDAIAQHLDKQKLDRESSFDRHS